MKNVLITGASRGIGFEIARQLAHTQFHVIITARNEINLSEALSKIKNEKVSAEMLVMDVSNASTSLRQRKFYPREQFDWMF